MNRNLAFVAFAIRAMIFLLIASTGLADITSIQQAINHAELTNPDYIASTDQYQSAKYRVREAVGKYYPKFDANYGYGREASDTPGLRLQGLDGYKYLNRRDSGLAVTQLVYDGGNVPNQIRQAKASADQAWETSCSDKQALYLNTIFNYMDILRNRKIVKYNKQNVAVHEKVLYQSNRKLTLGATRKSEVTLSASRLAQAKASLTDAEKATVNSENNFIQIVGAPAGYALKAPNFPATNFPLSLKEAERLAVKNNPDIKAAASQVRADYAAVGIAKSKFIPTFEIVGEANRDENVGGVEGEANNNMVTLQMTYNLFNGGSDKANVSAEKMTYYKDIQTKLSTIRSVLNTVRISWEAVQASKRNIKELSKAVNEEQKTVYLYDKEYKIGRRTLLDLLNVQNNLFDAQIELTNEKFTYVVAGYQLLQACGVLNKVRIK